MQATTPMRHATWRLPSRWRRIRTRPTTPMPTSYTEKKSTCQSQNTRTGASTRHCRRQKRPMPSIPFPYTSICREKLSMPRVTISRHTTRSCHSRQPTCAVASCSMRLPNAAASSTLRQKRLYSFSTVLSRHSPTTQRRLRTFWNVEWHTTRPANSARLSSTTAHTTR